MLNIHSNFELKDVKSFTLRGSTLKKKAIGSCLKSQKFEISNSGGLKWWIRVFPAGSTEAVKGFVSLFIYVNKAVNTKFKCVIDGYSIQKTFTYDFAERPRGYGWTNCVSHESLGPVSNKRKLTFTCIVEFDIAKLPDVPVPRVFQLFHHEPPEFNIVVAADRLPVHKHFLMLISPVFKEVLSHADDNANQVEVTAFSFDTVKSAIDFCYGRELVDLSVETAVNVLRFCDTYSITAAIEELEKLPLELTTNNFSAIVRYSYDCNKKNLFDKCCGFFDEYMDDIKEKAEFIDLPPALVVDILKKVFVCSTFIDLPNQAQEKGFGFIAEHLEEPIINSMSLENFCPIVRYAWKWSRENMKTECARYLIDNREEVTDSEEFLNLGAETVLSVLKVAHETKREIAKI